jgi:dipeptidyl aminopeptidase/acylaminoacyl peptidase
MLRRIAIAAGLAVCAAAVTPAQAAPAGFSLKALLGYPFPPTLIAGADKRTIAYVLDERGVRNIFVATAPDYAPRMVTHYTSDDGQELTNVHVSADGKYVVYVRGGDHDSNWPPPFPPDPAKSPVQPQMEVWSVAIAGGNPVSLGGGDAPAISPDSKRVAFIAGDQSVLSAPIDGSAKADRLFFDEGQDSDLEWSPDGSALAFVSTRTDHSFIGVYRNQNTPLEYLQPSTSQDVEPRWSPDGTRIAFLRVPGEGGPPIDELEWHLTPWAIWVANADTGHARRAWQSGSALRDSFPDTFDPSLRWSGGNALTFVSSADGWAHVYAVSAAGGTARLLTPGAYMVEDTAVSPDGKFLVYTANTGKTAGDFERRHLFRVDVQSGRIAQITSGTSSQWSPVVADGGRAVAFVQAGSKEPPLVNEGPLTGGKWTALDRNRLPADFPVSQLVVPKSVTFRASDGHIVHGQLFQKAGTTGKMPAVIFVHGGPPRQMLTTWHYMDYYSNGYAVNQYLANRGFVVLSVNYRLSIGYGYNYTHPARWGPTGASEYKDVLAGNAFLQRDPAVDSRRIGIWGGSYGGYLTALALARNSDRFCTGVDWHGVHDWSTAEDLPDPPVRYQMPDMKKERRIAWESSPDSAIATWKSPVLLVQGDDDHNVRFHQTVDLARRLDLAHVPYDELVIPNEIHGFLRYATFLETDQATIDYLTGHLSAASCARRR